MHKIVLLMFITNALMINSLKPEENEYRENYVTTEPYHTSYQEVLVFESNGDQETDFMTVEFGQSGEVPNNVTDPIIPERYADIIDYSQISTTELDLITKAEAEIKAWAENLDCSTSPIGPFKCTMVKKITKRFFERAAGIDYKKLAAHLKAAIKKLEDGDTPMDSEMKNLIQKYKKFINIKQ